MKCGFEYRKGFIVRCREKSAVLLVHGCSELHTGHLFLCQRHFNEWMYGLLPMNITCPESHPVALVRVKDLETGVAKDYPSPGF